MAESGPGWMDLSELKRHMCWKGTLLSSSSSVVLEMWTQFCQIQVFFLEQGGQTHFHLGPHQPCSCLQRAECNLRIV